MSAGGLAAFVAAHPLAVFAALLIVLASAGALLVLAAGRLARVEALRVRRLWATAPSLRLPTLLVVGIAGVAVALGAFFEIADEIEIDEPLGRFDDALAAALRGQASAHALRSFALITRMGDPWLITVLCAGVAAVLLWRGRRLLAAIWVAAVAGNGALTRLLKALFERTRPLHEHGWTQEVGWSFPSGHASAAMAAYGMLAYLLVREAETRWRWAAAPIAATLILLVGYSRIVLQVHYFSDVLAGFASAAAWLAVCIVVAELLRAAKVDQTMR